MLKIKKVLFPVILILMLFSSSFLYGDCKDISGKWFIYIYDIYDDTCGTSLLGFENFLNGTGALITVEQNQCDASLDTYFASNIPSQKGTVTEDNLTTAFTIDISDVGLKYDVTTMVEFNTNDTGEGVAYYNATAYNITCTFKSHLKFVKIALLSEGYSCDTTGETTPFTKDTVTALQDGWSLMGTCESISDLLGIFGNVKTVWAWNGTSWMIYSPLDAVKDLIQKYSIAPLTSIPANSGFWVDK